MTRKRLTPKVERIYRVIGKRTRERRLELARTQQWLADRMGWSRASIANLETGRQRILLHHLPILARALRMPKESLLP